VLVVTVNRNMPTALPPTVCRHPNCTNFKQLDDTRTLHLFRGRKQICQLYTTKVYGFCLLRLRTSPLLPSDPHMLGMVACDKITIVPSGQAQHLVYRSAIMPPAGSLSMLSPSRLLFLLSEIRRQLQAAGTRCE
jgi:hypothetical protein